MQPLKLDRIRCVLCFGAHPDDIEIGCGATIAKTFSPSTEVHWIVFSGNEIRRDEARASAECWLDAFAHQSVEVLDYEDGYMPTASKSIKRDLVRLSNTFSPDLIFTHHLQDRHQDHRLLAELTWQTFRNHTIFEYEIPKYEGDLGHPNVYIPIEEKQLNLKVERLLQFHQSQASKEWFDREFFCGYARLRGAECSSRYAEAFHARKLVIQ